MKQIGLNLQPLVTSALTGIGVYTLEVAKRLPSLLSNYQIEGQIFDFVGRNQGAEQIARYLDIKTNQKNREDSLAVVTNSVEQSQRIPLVDLRICKLFPLGLYIRAGILGRIISYEKLLKSDAKATVFFNYLRPYHVKGKSIITIYDMVYKRFPETMDQRNRKLIENFLDSSCQRAHKVVTISEFSKREIVDCLGIDPRKIVVAPCGIDGTSFYPPVEETEKQALARQVRQKYGVDGPYFLYLGTLEPRKNVDTLLEAFVIFHQKHPQVKLMICGGMGWGYEQTLAHLERLNLDSHIIRTGFVDEKDKRMLYCCAEAFIFPSLYEGFGLPPLEAMACGTPVICSDTSSLPEVVGEAGILCNSMDPADFARAMEKLYLDQSLRHQIQHRQISQVSKFSWDYAAQEYAKAIRSLFE